MVLSSCEGLVRESVRGGEGKGMEMASVRRAQGNGRGKRSLQEALEGVESYVCVVGECGAGDKGRR